MTYLQADVPQLDTVELDSKHGTKFIDSEMQLRKYQAHLGAAESVALALGASRDFIHSLISDL